MSDGRNSAKDLDRIIESANRLGVEMNEADALQWLTAISVINAEGDDVVVDVKSGVFGHKVSMLDFSKEDLSHFLRIGKIVEFEDRPGVVTALALSGSAAQSKIQTYPGDADYFERVNIHAGSREKACHILGELMRYAHRKNNARFGGRNGRGNCPQIASIPRCALTGKDS